MKEPDVAETVPRLTKHEHIAKRIVDYIASINDPTTHYVGVGIARILYDAFAASGEQRCDCGAELTQCYDCAIGDYQAAHPDCSHCCVQENLDSRGNQPTEAPPPERSGWLDIASAPKDRHE